MAELMSNMTGIFKVAILFLLNLPVFVDYCLWRELKTELESELIYYKYKPYWIILGRSREGHKPVVSRTTQAWCWHRSNLLSQELAKWHRFLSPELFYFPLGWWPWIEHMSNIINSCGLNQLGHHSKGSDFVFSLIDCRSLSQ